MQKWILVLACAGVCSLGFSQDKMAYIELYKDIAISEMWRTGIPASIKLAQAIHESSCGKSELACKANNHFGIKCGNDWKGKTYRKEDDDYENGELVKSCFREFKTVYDSYIAHSDFLSNTSKSNRYGHLFQLDITDYKGWAKGLSKAGYATDPSYASKIISIIEKYELYQYDSPSSKELVSTPPKKSTGHNLVRLQNDVKYILANAGDTPMSIAKRHDLSARQIVKYNDGIDDPDQELTEGYYVYLQPKRNQNRGRDKYHLMKSSDNLVDISQQYGINLSALLSRNGLQPGDIPAPNQKILLKGKAKTALRTINPYDVPSEKSAEKEIPLAASSTHSASINNTIDVKPADVKYELSTSPKIQTTPAKADHTVSKGETLYSIARQYEMTLDELKKMNNLSADTIFIGQKLFVK